MTNIILKRNRLIALGLFIVSVLVYGQALFFDYINYDDPYYLEKGFIRDGFHLTDLKALFSEIGTNLWHPVTWASFYLDSYFKSSQVSHGINILLHALNGCLLYLIIRKIPIIATSAIFVAIIHIIHPLHIENVAWVSARKDLLSLGFILLSLNSFVAYCKREEGCWRVLMFFFLALMSKPVAVVTPALFVAIALCFNDSMRKRSSQIFISSSFIISILFCGFTIWIHRNSQNAEIVVNADSIDKWALVGYNYIHYCYQFVLPNNLSFFYPSGGRLPLYTYVGYATFLISLLAVIALIFKRFQKLSILWLLYFITLAPASGIITIGDAIRADRYMYIPAIFLALIVVEGGIKLASKLNRKMSYSLYSITVIWAVFLLIYGQFYLSKWQTNQTLYRYALALNPKNYLAYHNLARDMERRHLYDLALQNYYKVLEIIPEYKNTRLRIARIYESHGEMVRAFSLIEQEYQNYPTAENLLALAYNSYLQQKFAQCIQLLNNPKHKTPNLSLLKGSAYLGLKQYTEAIKIYRSIPLLHFKDTDLIAYAYALIANKNIQQATSILKHVKNQRTIQYQRLIELIE